MALRFLKKLAQSKSSPRLDVKEDQEKNNQVVSSSLTSSSSFVSTSADNVSRRSRGSNNTYSHIPFHQREPETWSTNDVCLWLTSIGFSSYADSFSANDVTGKELIELELSDLKHLGIEKWGHRKKLIRRLRTLCGESLGSLSASDSCHTSQSHNTHQSHMQSYTSNGHLNSSNSQHHHSNYNNINNNSTTYDLSSFDETSATTSYRQDELIIKCIFTDMEGGDNVRVLAISREQPFVYFMQRVSKEAGLSPREYHNSSTVSSRLLIQFKDVEGDLITIRDKSDFDVALTCSRSEMFLKLWVSVKKTSPNLPPRAPTSRNSRGLRKASSTGMLRTSGILESLTDGAIIIDTKGTMKFVNHSTTKLFQYSREELLGKNVKMLMEDKVAVKHDRYIRRYLKTGKRKILGTGRKVTGVRKDGSRFKLWLTASENLTSEDHVFVATLHQVDEQNDGSDTDSREMAAEEEEEEEEMEKEKQHRSELNYNTNENYRKQEQRDRQRTETENYMEGVKSLMHNLMEAAILTNRHGNVVFMNKAAQSLLEFRFEDLVGQSVSKIIPKAYLNEDKRFNDYVNNGASKMLGQAWDTVLQTKIGSVIPVTMSLSLFQQNDDTEFFLNIIRQRTVSQDMEKSVLQQEREVVGNLALPGVIIDENCRIQGFNDAASKFLGYTLMEVLGKNVKLLLPPGAHRDHHDEYVHQYLVSGKGSIIRKTDREVNAMDKNGTALPIWLSVTERKLKDGKRIFTGILHPRK